MVVGVLSGYQCSHKSFINQSQLWAFEQGGFWGCRAPCCCFLMNTHKVANEAAEWEDEELSPYTYEYIYVEAGRRTKTKAMTETRMPYS